MRFISHFSRDHLEKFDSSPHVEILFKKKLRWIFFPSIKDLIGNTTFNWNFLAKVNVCTYVKFSIILGNNRTKKQKLRGHFALLAVIWHRTLSRNRGDFSNLQCAPKMENKCKNNKMCIIH